MAKIPVDKPARKPVVNMALLKPEDIAELRAKAKKSVLEEMQQDTRDAYLAKAMEEARREHVPEDQMVMVTIDVAPFSPGMCIDEVQYFHGYTYEVPSKLRAVMFEQMFRSWRHQDEIDGRAKTEAYRTPREIKLGPRDAYRSASSILGV